VRVLVFGDSVAQGFWDIEGGWVARLRKYYDNRQIADLRNRNEPVIFNLGVSGGTSETILDRFESEIRARQHRSEELCIVVSSGLNDSYREGQNTYNTTLEAYSHNFQQFAKIARKYTHKLMFVGLVACDEKQTTPVFWRDIYYTNERIQLFEGVMEKVATKNGIAFVPVFDMFKSHLDAGEKLLADGLHPNDAGHELISRLVRPELEKLINS